MRVVLIILSSITFGVGLVGVIIPVLPTTPFILLTLFLLSKSSPKYYNWLIKTRFYKKHIESFHINQSMTFKQKWSLLIFVDSFLLLSFIQINSNIIKLLVIVLFIAKHYYFKKYIKVI
jgi:uncharacterized membrane protein YbaN (DUF454 family)